MKQLLFGALVVISVMPNVCSGTLDQFEEFKIKFGRKYDTSLEEQYRRGVFMENMKTAAKLQSKNPLATFGMTEYTDILAADFKKHHHNANFSSHLQSRKSIAPGGINEGGTKIDWRTKGAVTAVKNQKNCGGCWSFSSTGNIEGQWFLAGHNLTSLSEQQLLSCDTNTGNDGCDGGIMDYAFDWIVKYNQGNIDTEASYPFVSGKGKVPQCHTEGTVVGANISGHVNLPQDEDQIANYVFQNGPVSIGVDGSSFQTYTGGILTNCEDQELDHAVLIVGYDDSNSPPYWIIKNSWGVSWGESGYIRVEKGTNQCGLKNAACSSFISAPPTTTPAPPPTPAPPTLAPPTGKNFSVSVCLEPGCSDCTSYTFVQGDCVDEEWNGDSFRAYCDKGSEGGEYVHLYNYLDSGSCTSYPPGKQYVKIDACYENVDRETYLKFNC